MDVITLKDRPDLARICRAIGSKKHKCYLSKYRPGNTAFTGWDGGSRDEWYTVYPNRVEFLSMEADPNRMGDPFNQRKVLPQFPVGALAVVQCGTSCGKPATPHVYLENI